MEKKKHFKTLVNKCLASFDSKCYIFRNNDYDDDEGDGDDNNDGGDSDHGTVR